MKQISQNLIEICNLLSDLKSHDGTSIGENLNVSRTAIWKNIKKLQSYDVEIEAQKSKGYIFKTPLILLNPKEITKNIKHKNVKLEVFESLLSTNDYLNEIKTPFLKPHICLSEQQTKGKGRFDRLWHAPFAKNISCSIGIQPTIDISELGGLSIAIGIATCNALKSILNLDNKLQLKWPNDIYYDDKKLGGILIEVKAETNGQCRLVIGIGINVNLLNAKKNDISQNWTSLQQMTNTYHNRNLLVSKLIDEVLSSIEIYEKSSLNTFLEKWDSYDYLKNKKLILISGKHEFIGIANGINQQGHLVLKLDSGEEKAFASGETTIKKR